MKHKIYLQILGLVDKSIVVELKKNLELTFKRFKIKFKICSNDLLLYQYEYDSTKDQFDSKKLLERLLKQAERKKHFRILGIIDRDIYFESYNFNFGVAKRPSVALISIYRLKQELYGRKKNPALFEKRILTESVHELGHTFGLDHCENDCVMQFSDKITPVDKKPSIFCDRCMGKLDEVFLNFD